MSNNKEKFVSPPPEADGNYRYCLIGSFTPVRVTLDEQGRDDYITEAPDPENSGKLSMNLVYLSAIFKDENVEEITKEQFIKYCQDYMATRSKHIIVPMKLDHN